MIARRFRLSVSIAMASFALALSTATASAAVENTSTPLHDGWALQSGCKLQATGDAISAPASKPEGWMNVQVPTTVLAAQVAAGQVKDPYYGNNLRSIPGTEYAI